MLEQQAVLARAAARKLANLSPQEKNEAMTRVARVMAQRTEEILAANAEDLAQAKAAGTSAAMMDRLALNRSRVDQMIQGLLDVTALPDPTGAILETIQRPNGLTIEKVRVPFGVIGIVYEARPNVTVDAAALCLKAGSAVMLKGGSNAAKSNETIVAIIRAALADTAISPEAVQFIGGGRQDVDRMLKLNGLLDVIIPRGGAGLIRHVVETATVPVIETGVGNCHIYVDRAADLTMAGNIILNAKTQRPAVCNAAETLLVHRDVADRWLPQAARLLTDKGVQLRGCPATKACLPEIAAASDADWGTEYSDLILSVKVVSGLTEAIEHINHYGTRHSECIVTEDPAAAEEFLKSIDAACVYHNASTRFTDGGEFGFGAEIGISTQKLHARGPMGLAEITSYKYLVRGNGQIR